MLHNNVIKIDDTDMKRKRKLETPTINYNDSNTNYKIKRPKVAFKFQENSLEWLKYIENEIVSKKKSFEYKMEGDFKGRFTTKGAIFANEMGLGKTIVIAKLLTETYEHNNNLSFDSIVNSNTNGLWAFTNSTLIICPSHIVTQWKDELLQENVNFNIIIICNKRHYQTFTYKEIAQSDIVICSHTLLLNNGYNSLFNRKFDELKKKGIYQLAHNFGSGNTFCENEFWNSKNVVLQVFNWKRIIIDEAHEVLCPTQSSIHPKYRLISSTLKSALKWYVSGTPFPSNDPTYICGIANFMECRIKVFDDIMSSKKSKSHTNSIKQFSETIFNIFNKNLFHRISYKELQNTGQVSLPGIKENTIILEMSISERNMYKAAQILYKDNLEMLRMFCCHPNILPSDVIGDNEVELVPIDEIQQRLLKNNTNEINECEVNIVKLTEALNLVKTSLATTLCIYEDSQHLKEDTKEITNCLNKAMNPIPHKLKYYQAKQILDTIKMTNPIFNLNTPIETLENKLKEINKVLKFNTNRLKLLQTQHPFLINNKPTKNKKINKETQTCKICYEDQFSGIISVLPCGHMFCTKCIQPWLEHNNTCPTCRTLFKEDQIILSKNEDSIGVSEIDKQFSPPDDLINKYGTKLASLIYFIKKLLYSETKTCKYEDQHSFIVFSQWHKLLLMVGRILEKENIRHVYCHGSPSYKIKAINDFKNYENKNRPRVIMLSLKHCASGTNLTNSNHVLILDPIDKNIEKQAISRSHRIGQTKVVNVYRMIMKDTEEEALYNSLNFS